MWAEIIPLLSQFHSAVLTMIDMQGYPLSVRCRPVIDASAGRFMIAPLPVDVRFGRASLLFHKQGEHIDQLKSFLLRGAIHSDHDQWIFTPSAFVPGIGIGGFFTQMRFLREGKRAAKRYLAQRGLPYPTIAWDDEEAYLRSED